MSPIALAVVGLGKIARDQHLPAIEASQEFRLTAAASHQGKIESVPMFATLADLLASAGDVQAVSFCTPPVGRFEDARAALAAGRHVMLEKPPGATVAEVVALADLARAQGCTLFCAWHSREADAVRPAKDWLADRTVKSAHISWREDVRRWHPGQTWIWRAGGLGVFDPGINALSILTEVLPETVRLTGADLDFPSNCDTPIAANLTFAAASGAPVTADFDFLQTGPQTWEIRIQTDDGDLRLIDGGARMEIDGVAAPVAAVRPGNGEYPNLYRRFADLIRRNESDVDLTPLQLVADAFLLGRRRTVEAFHE